MSGLMLLLLLLGLAAGLLSGFPVAIVLAGISLIFAGVGALFGIFDIAYLEAIPNRIYGIMTNDLLIAIPLFVFMGTILERAKIAEELLESMTSVLGDMRAGLGISVMIVGVLLAASTGIVGATVVTMGLISLPCMLKTGYNTRISSGMICAAGTLGQIIPPSIILLLLGDQISSSYQTAQLKLGNISPEPVSIADLFMGAVIPGLGLVVFYIIWIMIYSRLYPNACPPMERREKHKSWFAVVRVLIPPLLLIVLVLGSILSGVATATESAAVGAIGALVLAATHRQLSIRMLQDAMRSTTQVSCMVFAILIGAAFFTLVFRGYGGDDLVHEFLTSIPGGLISVMLITMILMFLLGFFIDFIEIIYIVVPIVAPVLLMMGAHPIWLAIMIAVNLQTSFLTPPFGFALFYLRGVAPKEVLTKDIYKGVVPFVVMQLLMLGCVAAFPSLSNWLPETLYDKDFSYVKHEQGDSLYVLPEIDF